jgi:hypothetical protein
MCSTAAGGGATTSGLSDLEIDGRSIANFWTEFPDHISGFANLKVVPGVRKADLSATGTTGSGKCYEFRTFGPRNRWQNCCEPHEISKQIFEFQA